MAGIFRCTGKLVLVTTIFLAPCFAANGGRTQPANGPQKAGAENTKMWPYKALAEMAYSAFEKGENARAAELAHVLERVWDKSEDYGGEAALSKTNADAFKQIDSAMDEFINPLMDYAKKAPDKAKLKEAYNAYLEKLKLAD